MYYGVLNLIVESSHVKMCGCRYIHCDFDASLFAPKKRYEPFTIVISLFQYSVSFTTTPNSSNVFSLRSKRFLLVSEQRKIEGQDFRFWPRENGLAIRNIGNTQVALFFVILLLRLCCFVLLLLILSLL